MDSGAKAVVRNFHSLASGELAERDRSAIRIPDELAKRQDVVMFLAWMNTKLTSRKEHKEQLTRIEAELGVKRLYMDKLRVLHEQLCQHKMKLVEEQNVLKRQETSSSSRLQKAIDDVTKENKKFNSELERVSTTVSRVAGHYNDAVFAPEPEGKATFVSRVSLDSYLAKESRFLSSLTEYSKHQHLKGLAGVITSGKSDEVMVDLGVLISGNPKCIPAAECEKLRNQLKILQIILPETRLKLISSSVAERHLAAAGQFLAKKLQEETQEDVDSPEAIEVLQESQARLFDRSAEQKRGLAVLHQGLPVRVRDLVRLQVCTFEDKRCDLKLARQAYFLSKLDKVTEALVEQCSRYEVLSLLHQQELRGHQAVSQVLAALRLQLGQWNSSFKDRMSLLREPSVQHTKRRKVAVHSEDHTALAAHRLLEDSHAAGSDGGEVPQRPEEHVLTYSSISQQLQILSEQIGTLREGLHGNQQEHSRRVQHLEQSLATLRAVVYSGRLGEYDSGGKDLTRHLQELEQTLGKVEVKMKEALQSRDAKKQALEKDELMKQERSLFPLFMTDCEGLQQAIRQLAARVDTLAFDPALKQ